MTPGWQQPAHPPAVPCPGQWFGHRHYKSRVKKIRTYFLTLPSAPSSTPSSPSTISVETETPPEGCRCFCPSILRSLNADRNTCHYNMHKPTFLSGKHQVCSLPIAKSNTQFSCVGSGQSCNPTTSKKTFLMTLFKTWRYSCSKTKFHLILTLIIPIHLSKVNFFSAILYFCIRPCHSQHPNAHLTALYY